MLLVGIKANKADQQVVTLFRCGALYNPMVDQYWRSFPGLTNRLRHTKLSPHGSNVLGDATPLQAASYCRSTSLDVCQSTFVTAFRLGIAIGDSASNRSRNCRVFATILGILSLGSADSGRPRYKCRRVLAQSAWFDLPCFDPALTLRFTTQAATNTVRQNQNKSCHPEQLNSALSSYFNPSRSSSYDSR